MVVHAYLIWPFRYLPFFDSMHSMELPSQAMEQLECLEAFLTLKDVTAVRRFVSASRSNTQGIFERFRHYKHGQQLKREAAAFSDRALTHVMPA